VPSGNPFSSPLGKPAVCRRREYRDDDRAKGERLRAEGRLG